MITCPWCGTGYTTFQPNCKNCGGSMPLPVEKDSDSSGKALAVPPPAPRDVPRNYIWRILLSDGWAITGGILALVGAIFGVVGFGLTAGIVTAFVGLPFAALGVLGLGGGTAVLVWRYQEAQKIKEVLKEGETVLGEIENVQQVLNVRVNGRHPWTISYGFEVSGRLYQGKLTTLSQPDLSQQPETDIYVLYMQENPEQNTIYPHPYAYFAT